MPPDRTHSRKAGVIRVGISGWRYPPWRGTFYPRGLPQRRELEFASRHVATIEINGSFYSLQRPEFYARWRENATASYRTQFAAAWRSGPNRPHSPAATQQLRA